MVKIKKVKGYECGSCMSFNEDEQDAEDCCPNFAEEVDAFECGECNEIHQEEDDAKECCKDDE